MCDVVILPRKVDWPSDPTGWELAGPGQQQQQEEQPPPVNHHTICLWYGDSRINRPSARSLFCLSQASLYAKLTSNTLLSSHLDIDSRDSFTLPLYSPPFANRVLSRTSPRTPLVTFQLHTRIHRTAVRSPFPALDGSHHVGLTMFTIPSTRPYKLAVYIPPAPPV